MSAPSDIDPRVTMAAERTLLAWVRTGVAMMGFGFVVARFGLFLREIAALGHPDLSGLPTGGASLWIGTALVVLGAVTNVMATIEHRHFMRDLYHGTPPKRSIWGLATVVALLLAIIGIVMAAYLVFVGHPTGH